MIKKFSTDSYAVGSAILKDSRAIRQEPVMVNMKGRYEIGACGKVRIKCVSESVWSGTEAQKENGHAEYEGNVSSSRDLDSDYTAGNCALIETEMLDGSTKRFLFDSGGDENNLDKCLKREGINDLLKDGGFECIVLSHEHRSHCWGLGAVLAYNPQIRIYLPSTFDPKKFYCLASNEFVQALGTNWVEHQGALVKLGRGEVVKLCEGCVAITFDCISYGQVHSETSLCFQIKDTGLVFVSGCCHQGIMTLAGFVRQHIECGEEIYGFYGGLHIAPFGQVTAEGEAEIERLSEYGFSKIACNHCTGKAAIERMHEMRYPVAKGTARYGSESNLWVGNGDEVFFGGHQ